MLSGSSSAFLACLILSFGGAFATAAPLPAEVALNKDAGRMGWWLLPLKMTNGQELLFMVDTGCPITLLDPSLTSKLEKSFDGTLIFNNNLGNRGKSAFYKTPKLLLGGVPLLTGSNCFSFPCDVLSRFSHQKVAGMIGMDCLINYCVQLDFEAGKARFLDAGKLDTNKLGKAFAIEFLQDEGMPADLFTAVVPVVNRPGFLGTKSTRLLLDLGDNVDGGVENGGIQGHYLTRLARFFLPHRALRISQCIWDDQSYTGILLDQGNIRPNRLGIRFFARHLTTFDFPDKTLYLKKIRTGPFPDLK